jgi:hypothetical protein
LRLGVDALPFFPHLAQNPTATVWSYIGLIAGLFLMPIAFAVFTKLKAVTLMAIGLTTLAFSAFAAQALLLLVDRVSDQTYLLLNPYLKEVNPSFPLVLSFIALMISIMRLKTYQVSQE